MTTLLLVAQVVGLCCLTLSLLATVGVILSWGWTRVQSYQEERRQHRADQIFIERVLHGFQPREIRHEPHRHVADNGQAYLEEEYQ